MSKAPEKIWIDKSDTVYVGETPVHGRWYHETDEDHDKNDIEYTLTSKAEADREGRIKVNLHYRKLYQIALNKLRESQQREKELREYVRHDMDCPARIEDELRPCKCGLERILNQTTP